MGEPCTSLMPTIALVFMTLTATTAAQNSPEDYLVPHNTARAQVGVDPLEWDGKVAAYAESYARERADDCALRHSGGGLNRYGENIFWGSGDGGTGTGGSWAAADAVKLWVAERANYDYRHNSCAGGECLHYTQVVWRGTAKPF